MTWLTSFPQLSNSFLRDLQRSIDDGFRTFTRSAVMVAQHGFDALPEASIAAGASIAEALQQMAASRLQALRVQNPEGEPIGVIPFQDAINAYTGSREANP